MSASPGESGFSLSTKRDSIGREATLWLGLGAAAATALIFALPPTPFESLDFSSILLPYLTYYRDSLAAGEFPFWNPHASLGRPFAADPQAIVFWPPVLAYLGLNLFGGAVLLAWLHAWMAAWSSARLCLRLGAGRLPALLSGLAFVLSGKITGHYQAGHLQFVFSYLYLPPLLYAAVLVQENGNRRSVALLGALSGWQLLAGAPQVYWSCALALALFLAGRRFGEPAVACLRGIGRDGARVAAAYALGLALAAVLLVPLSGLIAESNRAAARPEFIAVGSMEWRHWASVLTPSTARNYTVDWEMLLYPGLTVTVLGLAGLLRGGDRTVRGLWLLLAVTGVLAAGGHSPLFQTLVDWLPGYASFRVHGRLGAVLVYALILAGVLLTSDRTHPRRQLGRLLAVATLCLAGLILLAARASADIVRPLFWLAVATGAGAAWFLASGARLRVAAGALLAGGLLADLVIADLHLKRVFITTRNYSLEAPLLAALHEAGRLQAGQPPPRIFAPASHVRANAGMIYGFGTIAGSEALALERVWSYVHWAVGREAPPTSDIYDFDAFVQKGQFAIPWVAQTAALNLRAGLIEIAPVPPARAWLVGRVREVADWQEGAGRLAAGHDARASVLLTDPLPPGFDVQPAAAEGQVRWKNFSRNRLALEVDAPAAGVLVLSEAWQPGWRATVNAQPAPVFAANGWMRGIAVPAGVTQVELRYRPVHFVAGVIISALALALLLWLARPLNRPSAPAPG